MENLLELKQQVLAYCEKRKANGGLVTNYNCPDCNKELMNITPNEIGQVWDSATKCYECGQLHFVVKKIGKITATSLG